MTTNTYREALFFYGLENPAGTKASLGSGSVVDIDRDSMAWSMAGAMQAGIPYQSIRQHLDGPGAIAVSGAYWDISFQQKVKASTGATARPEIDPVLRACGMSSSVGASVIYTPYNDPNASSAYESMTLRREQTINGNVYEAFGVRGNFSFTYQSEGALLLSFNGIGAYVDPSGQSALTVVGDANYNAGNILTKCTTCTFFGVPLSASAWSLNAGFQASPIQSITNAGGHYYQWPAPLTRPEQRAVGTVTCLLDKESTFDLFNKIKRKDNAAGTVAFGFGARSLTFNHGEVRIVGYSAQEQDGAVQWTLTYEAVSDGINPGLKITFA
jgi:hypothetical protein